MISFLLIAVCVVILLFYNGYKYLFDRPENFPPGKMKSNFLKQVVKKLFFLNIDLYSSRSTKIVRIFRRELSLYANIKSQACTFGHRQIMPVLQIECDWIPFKLFSCYCGQRS